MQIAKIEYSERTVITSHHGFNIAALDRAGIREGLFFRYYYLQNGGADASIGYHEMRDAKAQATKLAKAQATKQSYMP